MVLHELVKRVVVGQKVVEELFEEGLEGLGSAEAGLAPGAEGLDLAEPGLSELLADVSDQVFVGLVLLWEALGLGLVGVAELFEAVVFGVVVDEFD